MSPVLKFVVCILEGNDKRWHHDDSGTRSNTLALAVLSVLSLWLEDLLEINPHAQESYVINASTYILIFYIHIQHFIYIDA